jgi:ribonuclease D
MKEWFVDTPQELQRLVDALSGYDVVALDTEFLREKTYFAKMCLLQVACEDFVACVDPLAIENLQPILDVIYSPHVTKVMHSARQDLELFYDLTQRVPAPVFDTQIAATLLGFGDQLGYAALVKKMLGVTLAKTHTRTDWSQRPLDFGQIEYAVDDVRYLLEVYRRQREKLLQTGRMAWLENDFNALTDPGLYQQADENLWKKVRGNKTLHGVHVAALQLLTRWREQLARSKNRPRRWVVRDDVLIEIAKRMPQTPEALDKIHGCDAHVNKHAAHVVDLIKQAQVMPKERWPSLGKHARLTSEQEAQVDLLMAVVRTRAEENLVTPAVLASRKELECLVQGKHQCAVCAGWRAELVGNELRAIMNGERSVHLSEGKIEVR